MREKNKAIQMANGIGVQFPGSSAIPNGFVHSIHNPMSKVNNCKKESAHRIADAGRLKDKSNAQETDSSMNSIQHHPEKSNDRFKKLIE